MVYEPKDAEPAVKVPFLVQVKISDLNIKKGQGTARTEVACRQIITAKKNAWLESLALDGDKVTVADLCKRYLQSQYEQGVIKPSSRDRNMCTINNQIEGQLLGELAINKVLPSDKADSIKIARYGIDKWNSLQQSLTNSRLNKRYIYVSLRMPLRDDDFLWYNFLRKKNL